MEQNTVIKLQANKFSDVMEFLQESLRDKPKSLAIIVSAINAAVIKDEPTSPNEP